MSPRPMQRASTLLTAFLVLGGVVAVGCSKEEPEARPGDLASGEQIYASMCKSCHGARGEGGRGPVLRDIYQRRDERSLVKLIDARMPLGEPERCDAKCSADVGAYVWHKLRGEIVCDAPAPVARGLRLLTRREYKATIEDLFGAGGTAPTPPSDPATPCGTTSFTYDPQGRVLSTVHVAGSFNGWPATIAAGGYPLASANGKWTLTKVLPVGQYQYKLVLNESEWIVDPTNSKTVDNGLGGQNSRLDIACPSPTSPTSPTGSTSLDPTSTFPPDTRPEGFPFDDHGPGRVVTSIVMDEHARAARAIADRVDLAKLVLLACGNAPRNETENEACAAKLISQQGKRIFRRPLSSAEIDRYVTVARSARGAAGQASSSFDKGLRGALAAMLTAPSFVYRAEIGTALPNGTFQLGPWEIASALSYYLWGSMPDDELFAAAENGDLAKPDVLERQARRLLASPRARATVGVFAEQWLGVEGLTSITKDETRFPLSPAVRAAMLEETRRFVTHAVFEGSHTVDDLFYADYTFLNEPLAKHYGVSGVSGPEMRLVKLPQGETRAGLLGHGSVLSTTGHSDQTSPIRRGLFVRRRLLCQEFAPPPPNAGGVPNVDPKATTRERFAQHTSNPFCKSCHQYIDDVGFGFERFDTVGRTRDAEDGKPIDARGDMNDIEGFGKGTHAPYTSLAELGRSLAASDAAKTCVARQVWRFARGHLDDDVCQVASVKEKFLKSDGGRGDLRELLIAVVTDPAFTVRK